MCQYYSATVQTMIDFIITIHHMYYIIKCQYQGIGNIIEDKIITFEHFDLRFSTYLEQSRVIAKRKRAELAITAI